MANQALENNNMLVGEGGPQGGHCGGKSILMRHHHIGVALAEDHTALPTDLQSPLSPAVQDSLLGEYLRFRGVDVLGRRIAGSQLGRAQVAATEPDDSFSPIIEDGKDDPIAKSVVVTSPILFLQQPQLKCPSPDTHRLVSQQSKIIVEVTPSRRRIADAKPGEC